MPAHTTVIRTSLKLFSLCITILLFPTLFALPVQAQNQHDLNTLNATLKHSKQALKKHQVKRTKTLKKIKSLDKQIQQRAQKQAQTQLKQDKSAAQHATLLTQNKDLEQRLTAAQNRLAKLLTSTYLMGQQSGLKVALSQQGTQHMARLNHYAHSLSSARQTQLNAFNLLQTELKQKNALIETQQTKLDQLNKTLKEDQHYLTQLKNNRLAMVSSLELVIADDKQNIKQLRQRKTRLESLLAKLEKQQNIKAKKRALLTKQPPQKNEPRIASNNWPMPTNANIVAHFGDKRAQSGLPWSGVLLEGLEGAEVSAIQSGEVVYAGWLQGYGEMVIIDHGGGLMSLYGHNKALHKSIGEHVQQSDIIASMGDTAGREKAALYFEIRKDGVAQNPLKWCRI
ncbi:MAG: peptidoglycan DD-metalloendopeptidase family protein [Arenicellales bacterium]